MVKEAGKGSFKMGSGEGLLTVCSGVVSGGISDEGGAVKEDLDFLVCFFANRVSRSEASIARFICDRWRQSKSAAGRGKTSSRTSSSDDKEPRSEVSVDERPSFDVTGKGGRDSSGWLAAVVLAADGGWRGGSRLSFDGSGDDGGLVCRTGFARAGGLRRCGVVFSSSVVGISCLSALSEVGEGGFFRPREEGSFAFRGFGRIMKSTKRQKLQGQKGPDAKQKRSQMKGRIRRLDQHKWL